MKLTKIRDEFIRRAIPWGILASASTIIAVDKGGSVHDAITNREAYVAQLTDELEDEITKEKKREIANQQIAEKTNDETILIELSDEQIEEIRHQAQNSAKSKVTNYIASGTFMTGIISIFALASTMVTAFPRQSEELFHQFMTSPKKEKKNSPTEPTPS
jgi:hypothetical protein